MSGIILERNAKYIKDVKDSVENLNIISIIGTHGIGKTTFAFQLIESIIQDESNKFEELETIYVNEESISNDQIIQEKIVSLYEQKFQPEFVRVSNNVEVCFRSFIKQGLLGNRKRILFIDNVVNLRELIANETQFNLLSEFWLLIFTSVNNELESIWNTNSKTILIEEPSSVDAEKIFSHYCKLECTLKKDVWKIIRDVIKRDFRNWPFIIEFIAKALVEYFKVYGNTSNFVEKLGSFSTEENPIFNRNIKVKFDNYLNTRELPQSATTIIRFITEFVLPAKEETKNVIERLFSLLPYDRYSIEEIFNILDGELTRLELSNELKASHNNSVLDSYDQSRTFSIHILYKLKNIFDGSIWSSEKELLKKISNYFVSKLNYKIGNGVDYISTIAFLNKAYSFFAFVTANTISFNEGLIKLANNIFILANEMGVSKKYIDIYNFLRLHDTQVESLQTVNLELYFHIKITVISYELKEVKSKDNSYLFSLLNEINCLENLLKQNDDYRDQFYGSVKRCISRLHKKINTSDKRGRNFYTSHRILMDAITYYDKLIDSEKNPNSLKYGNLSRLLLLNNIVLRDLLKKCSDDYKLIVLQHLMESIKKLEVFISSSLIISELRVGKYYNAIGKSYYYYAKFTGVDLFLEDAFENLSKSKYFKDKHYAEIEKKDIDESTYAVLNDAFSLCYLLQVKNKFLRNTEIDQEVLQLAGFHANLAYDHYKNHLFSKQKIFNGSLKTFSSKFSKYVINCIMFHFYNSDERGLINKLEELETFKENKTMQSTLRTILDKIEEVASVNNLMANKVISRLNNHIK